MSSDFPRILTLLRKEKGISQKNAAAQLSISQALLSHYEKGIRECGLDFLVRCANYYGVSCDYLLGRSPDRQGSTLTVEDIPEPDDNGRENRGIGSVLPTLNKKLIVNSVTILFDLLARTQCKALIQEVSAFLMLAVYRMFRVVYSVNPKNQEAMFHVPAALGDHYATAAMQLCQANAAAIAKGVPVPSVDPAPKAEALAVSTEILNESYPQMSSSLFNVIQSSENRMEFSDRDRQKK